MSTFLRKSSERHSHLTVKVVFHLAVLVLCTAVLPGSILVYKAFETLTVQAGELQLLAAQLTADQLEIMLRNEMAALEGIAKLEPFKKMDKAQIDHTIHEIKRSRPGFATLIVMNTDGQVISSVDKPYHVGKNLATMDYFNTARTEGRSNFSDSLLMPDKTVAAVAATPIRNDQGQIVGVLAGTFDVNHTNFYQLILHPLMGNNGYAYLVDRKGTILAHPKAEWALKQVNLSQYDPVAAVMGGNKGISELVYNDQRVLAAYAPVEVSG